MGGEKPDEKGESPLPASIDAPRLADAPAASIASGYAAGRPETVSEYLEWAKATLSVDFSDPKVSRLYNLNAAAVQDAVRQSTFVQTLLDAFTTADKEYLASHKERLFMSEVQGVDIKKKPYQSAVEKTFRLNVLWNRKFPKPPHDGWITPENWFARLDDIVRTAIVCRFLDGPSFLCKELESHAGRCGAQGNTVARGIDEGYYAHHFYVTCDVDVLVGASGNPTSQTTKLEVQVTTQLQEILRSLTHQYYESDRVRRKDLEWTWKFKTNKFRARFLGHSLHLLEALIVDVRDHREDE